MSTAIFTFCAIFTIALSFASANAQSTSGPIKPFKDSLFSSFDTLESRDGGDYQRKDYQELRDINARDEVPERRVKRSYVDMGVKRHQSLETLALASGELQIGRVGPEKGQAFSVIFIHGRGGDRRLAMNDYSFGGNFNRLKNLVLSSGGTYYVPSIKTFDKVGVEQVADLIRYAERASNGKPVILACASMGSFLCYGLSRDAEISTSLKSMLILGGAVDPDFTKSAFVKMKKPIWFTHGSNDKTYLADQHVGNYEALRKLGVPVRLTIFDTGSHGTPIRMSDWRDLLNWSLTL